MERETGPEAAVQRLGEQWIRELAQPGGGSFVCSPAGLWLALTAVASGARGGTAAELRALLGVAGSEAAAVVTDAARDWGRTEALRVATRVWNSAPVHPEYERSLPDVAFGPVDAAEADAWVRERTDGLIDKLPLEIDGDMALVLVNVLALKALWERAFDTGRTRDAAFTDAAGTKPAGCDDARVGPARRRVAGAGRVRRRTALPGRAGRHRTGTGQIRPR